MGWNTSAVFVEHLAVPALVAALPGLSLEARRTLTAYEALSTLHGGDGSVGQAGAWTIVCDPWSRLAPHDELLAPLSRGRRLLAVTLSSVASTYGYAYYAGGATVRRIIYADDAVAAEVGPPLPEERGIARPSWGYDEAYIFTLIERFTGLTWADLETPTYTALSHGR